MSIIQIQFHWRPFHSRGVHTFTATECSITLKPQNPLEKGIFQKVCTKANDVKPPNKKKSFESETFLKIRLFW